MGTANTQPSSLNVERASTIPGDHHGRSLVTHHICIRIIAALLRKLLSRLLRIRTAADALPIGLMQMTISQGTTSSLIFIAVYLLFLVLWLPFKMLSLVITELGVYAFILVAIFSIGRSIIRLIAFPGASSKLTSEIETEFAKYSVRMITLASQSVVDVVQAIVSSHPNAPGRRANATAMNELPLLWNRAKSYRDRVLGVYVEVLLYLFQQPSMSAAHKPAAHDLTKFGNNRLSGDIGDLTGLTPQARNEGRELMERLQNVLQLLDQLQGLAGSVLEVGLGPSSKNPLNEDAFGVASSLLEAASELRDFTQSLRPNPSSSEDTERDGDEDLTMDTVRRKFEEQGSILEMVRNGVSSILSMMDPPPHNSIFGLDVQRGCMMSRYRGSRQLWVKRPGGGMIDVLHFPSLRNASDLNATPRAVLYCNPNAGLIEVAAGMSLVGGNIPSSTADSATENSWIDFYSTLGLDVYVFNYAGYGRSFGTTCCVQSGEVAYHPGCLARMRRIFFSTFFAFTPTPATLRSDAETVAKHLIHEQKVHALIIHGESIGGMAAAGAGKCLSNAMDTRNNLALLICDRTFCNLEAVAQRLVGGWSGYAIRVLAPFWNTDVAGDFIATTCPKIVAADAADCIIHDAPSLKAGVALWKEIHRGSATTQGIAWITEEPLLYRMADFENCCVNESKYLAGQGLGRATSPVWPADKHITLEEAFHFSACCKRIGKVAKRYRSGAGDAEQAVEFSLALGPMSSTLPLAYEAWKTIACCDGLTGSPLGVSVKQGFDATVAWLCSSLVYGPQRLVGLSDARRGRESLLHQEIDVSDFDSRPPGYEHEESEVMVHPKPIPEVVGKLIVLLERGDQSIGEVSHELHYVLGMLQYLQNRLSAAASISAARHIRELKSSNGSSVGCFMNLHCGHNNSFSKSEKAELKLLLDRAFENHEDGTSLELEVI